MKTLYIYLFIINIAAFAVYGADKLAAIKNAWRIPEKVLIGLAVAGGSIGALAAMYSFRHKTKKPKFAIGVPVILIVQVIIVIYLLNNGGIS